MNTAPKNIGEKETKPALPVNINTIIGGLILIGIIVIVINSLGSSPSPASTHQVQQPTVQSPSPSAIDLGVLKSKCAADGASYVKTYEQQYGSPKTVWYDPQFHYSTSLNTCLVYVGYIVTMWENPDLTTGNYNASLIGYNFIFDIYSNKPLLQSVFDRQDNNGVNTDTPSTPMYPEIPNLSGSDFNQQGHALLSQ